MHLLESAGKLDYEEMEDLIAEEMVIKTYFLKRRPL